MKSKTIILDEKSMQRAISRITYEIIERNKGVENLVIVGILSRGAQLAQRITAKIFDVEQKQVEIGYLDITPYRDDIKCEDSYKNKSEINVDLTNKKIILVDDVMYTGRSVRAAIDGIMVYGRPENIQLAVLIDRGHRELPIRADYVGKNLPTSREEKVNVLVKERDGEDLVEII